MRLSFKDLKTTITSVDIWFDTSKEFNTWVQRYKQHLIEVDERSDETSDYYHHSFLMRGYPCFIKCHIKRQVKEEDKDGNTTSSTAETDKVDM